MIVSLATSPLEINIITKTSSHQITTGPAKTYQPPRPKVIRVKTASDSICLTAQGRSVRFERAFLNRRKLLRRLRQGYLRNVPFRDFVQLVEGFGFLNVRQEGSHRAFVREQVQEILNLQPVRGEAKPYQIRQFLRLVEKYNLQLENGA